MAMKVRVIRDYRNIRWVRDQDPMVDALRTVVKAENHLSDHMAHQITGVSTATFANWFNGKTRCPQNATATQAAAALGYVRRDELTKDGHVVVGYVRARDLDYEKEIEKQADWFIKHHGPKKKRKPRRKTNGNGSHT